MKMIKSDFIFFGWSKCALIASFLFNNPVFAQEDLEKRVQKLEKRQTEMSVRQTEMYTEFAEGKGRVNSYFGTKVSLGGFFETAITNMFGPETQTQTSGLYNLFGLNISAEINEKSRFVAQFLAGIGYTVQNPHNNPSVSPNHREFGTPSASSLLPQAFYEYSHNPHFNVQTGIGYMPFGHALQQREPVLFKRRGGPQLASTSSANSVGIAFPLWTGIHIHGAFPVAEGRWGYNLYSFSPILSPKTIGGGARTWWSPSDSVTVGISGQSGNQKLDTYYSYGADIELKFEQFGIIVEYGRNLINSGLSTPTSYYAEPYYVFSGGQWVLWGAADYMDHPNNVTSAFQVSDPYQRWVYGGGINWIPSPFTRFRAGFLTYEYVGDRASLKGQNRSFNNIDVSAGITF